MRNKYTAITNRYLTSELNTALYRSKLTQEAFASILRISPRHVSYLLSGEKGFGVVPSFCFLAFQPEYYTQRILRNYRKLILSTEENEPLVHRKSK